MAGFIALFNFYGRSEVEYLVTSVFSSLWSDKLELRGSWINFVQIAECNGNFFSPTTSVYIIMMITAVVDYERTNKQRYPYLPVSNR